MRQLEEIHAARQQWHQHTEPVRQQALLAWQELKRRLGDEARAETAPVDESAHWLGPGPAALRRAVDAARQATQILRRREEARQQEADDPALSAEDTDRARRDTAMDPEQHSPIHGRTVDLRGLAAHPGASRQRSGPGTEV